MNKKVGTVYNGNFIDRETDLVVPMDDISIFLNDYFANVGTKLNSLNGTVLADLDGIYQEMNGESFSFPVVDRYDILFLGKDIDVHKSSCIPELRSDVCTFMFEQLPDKIASLFDASLMTSAYPTEWKRGHVNLIPKQGLLSNPSNWRPITQTHIFGKNLEKIVHRNLFSYLLDHGIISDRQYGFLPGRSTHEAIFYLSRHIYSSINNKKIALFRSYLRIDTSGLPPL